MSKQGVERVLDFSAKEQQHKYLEGTGAFVLDRVNGVAYLNVSERADAELAQQWVQDLGYRVSLQREFRLDQSELCSNLGGNRQLSTAGFRHKFQQVIWSVCGCVWGCSCFADLVLRPAAGCKLGAELDLLMVACNSRTPTSTIAARAWSQMCLVPSWHAVGSLELCLVAGSPQMGRVQWAGAPAQTG